MHPGKSPETASRRYFPTSVPFWLAALVLVAGLLTAYAPALQGGFLWDDDDHISNNFALRSMDGLRAIWFTPGATCQYYPLSFTVFWAGYHLWGLNTLGYHLLNVGLHATVAVLLWQVLARLKVAGAWLAGALFAFHPVCVMSVAWMTELKNTLSASLALASIWAYIRFARLGQLQLVNSKSAALPELVEWRFYALSLILFGLAMFAKTAVSFVPVSLLLIVWWQRPRLAWRDVWPLLPMLALGVVLGQLTISVEHHSGGATGKVFSLSPLERILVSGRSFWFYIGKLFYPRHLTFIYERWPVLTNAWESYTWPAATAALFAGLWIFRKRIGKGPLAAMAHFYVTTSMLVLFVVLYMTQYTWVTDHWQYFGCMGVFALTAAGLSRVFARFDPSCAWSPAVIAALLVLLGLLTWRQSATYSNISTLWRNTLANNPTCWMAYSNLGLEYLKKDQLDDAIANLQRSVDIEPNNASAQNNLGNALVRKGQWQDAVPHFEKTLQFDPANPDAHVNLGSVLLQQRHPDLALPHFQQAVEAQPRNATAQNSLAVALIQLGRLDEAITHFQAVVQLSPRDADARQNLGQALARKGNWQEAAAQLETAVELEPADVATRSSLADALLRCGRIQEAVVHYKKCLESQPDNVPILNRLALVLATCPDAAVRNGALALDLAKRARQLVGTDNPMLLITLAAAQAEAGQCPDAAITARRALEILSAEPKTSPALLSTIRDQVSLYEAGSPFRDPGLRPR